MAAAALAAQQAAALQQQQAQAAAQAQETQMLERCRMNFALACEAEEAAAAVVDRVVFLATEAMTSNHFDRLAIPYTVRCIVKETLDFIQCAFIGQDDGSTVDVHWHADPQADRVTVDPWARAAIGLQMPIRRLGNGGEFDAMGNTTASNLTSQLNASGPFNGSRTRGPAGNTGKKTAAGANTSSNSANMNKLGTAALKSSPSVLSPATNRSGDTLSRSAASTKAPRNGAGQSSSAGASQLVDGSNGQGMSAEEAEYLEQANAEARRRAEARALQDRISKQLDDVKREGNFTIDGSTGKVISIVNFDANLNSKRNLENQRYTIGNAPEALAPVKAPPGAGKTGARPGASNSAPAALSGTSPANSPTQVQALRRSNRRPEASDFYVEEASYGGPMVDNLTPAGGVALREKDVTLKGEFKVPKTRVSRAEYLKMASVGLTGVVGAEDGEGANNSPAQPSPIQPPKASPGLAASGGLVQSTSGVLAPSMSGVHAAPNEYRPQQIAALPVAKLAKSAKETGSSPRQKRAELAKQLTASSPGPSGKRRGTEVHTGATTLDDDDY